ncbi:MAG: hypothetical protein E7041_01145 [Lentisphaerae bacterium]|nr:hypothetical protein [Lentisphaerota bacterium]
MSFFRSFIGTCCGTEIFQKLRKQSWGKTLWHLFLLSLICAVFIGIGNYYMLKYRWRSAEAGFRGIFGSRVYLSEKGVIPESEPERSRRQEYPYNGLLIYVSPQGAEKEYPDETLFERNFIVLWHPSCFAFMLRQEEKWIFVKYNPDGRSLDVAMPKLSYQELKKKLVDTANAQQQVKWRLPSDYENGMTTPQLFKFIRTMFAIFKSLQFFFVQFFSVLLFTVFFASVFRLFCRNKLQEFSFAVMWKVSVYTAFPVMAVVSFFPALQLPGAKLYLELFVIGWLFYLFHVVRNLVLFQEDDDKKEEPANEQ